MPIRRAADPISVQHVWDAVRMAVLQRQMADSKRIVKYLLRVDKCTYAQAELYLQQTVHDGLIVALQKVTKSSKGDMIDSYRIPTQDLPPLDGKDWYCFECHLAGDVNTCDQCFRVFHGDCITNGRRKFDEFKKSSILYDQQSKSFVGNESTTNSINSINISSDSDDLNTNELSTYPLPLNNNDSNSGQSKEDTQETHNQKEIETGDTYNDGLCSICNISKLKDNCTIDKSELNYLLKYVIHRIQSWLPNTITHTMAAEERLEWLTDKELTWRSHQLFFEHRDMSVVEVNLNNESYIHVHEFLADILTIQHNVAIFHGIESQEYGAADLMMRDCMHDLTELRLCVDCYRHSNEKINPKWFCLPCRVPHKLVWAKQKGYPYWPAKVIQETSTHFDVRFFGGKYERSLLAKSFIKPIDTPQSKLSIKTSSAFNKSVEELRFHQRLLKNPDELQKVISASKSRPKNIIKPRISSVKKSLNSSEIKKRNNSFDINDVYKFDDVNCAQQPVNSSQDRLKRKSSLYEGCSASKKVSCVTSDEKHESIHNVSDSIIHISDGEDEEFSYRENTTASNLNCNGSHEQVSSSTEHYRTTDNSVPRSQENGMQQLDQPYSDSVEKMRRKLENLTEKKDVIKCAMDCMQAEIDKITNEHNEHLKKLFESHNSQISETKKKQWCYNCEQDAIYHCCWNTAYCSQSCQQQHWQAEHKKVCRRKR